MRGEGEEEREGKDREGEGPSLGGMTVHPAGAGGTSEDTESTVCIHCHGDSVRKHK